MLESHIEAVYSSLGWATFFMICDIFFLCLAMSGQIDYLLTGKKKKKVKNGDDDNKKDKQNAKISLADMAYWSTSVVGIIHSSLATYIAWNCGWENSYFTTYDLFSPSECSTSVFQVFVGYIACDTFWAIYFCTKFPGGGEMLFHHFISGTTFIDLLATNIGHNVGILVLLFEATTPFMNMRFLLSKMNMKHSILYKINGIIFTVGWFIFRIGLGVYGGYVLWQMRDQLWEAPPFTRWFSMIGTFFGGFALQCFWAVRIAKGFYKAISTTENSDKKNA